MNKEENFINTLFEKTEESEAIKPQTTEIIKMPMSSIVPNFKNPYKCREEDMKPLEDSIRENGIIQPLMVRKDDKADVYEIISGHRRKFAAEKIGYRNPILSADEDRMGYEKYFMEQLNIEALKQDWFVQSDVTVCLLMGQFM